MDKRLVRVVWNDAQDHADKWVGEVDAEAFGTLDCEIVSVGFLVSNTDKYITIAGDWDSTDKDYGRVTKVPIGMVKKIESLETEKASKE